MEDNKNVCETCGSMTDSSGKQPHSHESSNVCRKCGQIKADGHVHDDKGSQNSPQQ